MKAGLIDADIHGPSVPTLLGTGTERAHAIDKKLIPMEAHGIRALSVGMMVDTDRAIAWRGPMVAGALNQLLVDTEWGDTDQNVIDLPPRSEERRVGKECVRTCRSRGEPTNENKNSEINNRTRRQNNT